MTADEIRAADEIRGREQRQLAAFASTLLAPYRTAFEHKHNVVIAMEAWKVARTARLPLPEWLLRAVDAFAEGATARRGQRRKSVAAERKGAETMLRHVDIALRCTAEFRKAQREVHTKGLPLPPDDVIFGFVAEHFNLKTPTVRNIWYALTDAADRAFFTTPQ